MSYGYCENMENCEICKNLLEYGHGFPCGKECCEGLRTGRGHNKWICDRPNRCKACEDLRRAMACGPFCTLKGIKCDRYWEDKEKVSMTCKASYHNYLRKPEDQTKERM